MTQGDPQTPAPGWYPTPDGSQRFWDGTQWLALPAPEDEPKEHNGLTRRRPPRKILVIAAAVFVALVVVGTVVKVTNDARIESEQQAAQDAAELAADQAAQAEADRIAAATAAQEKADSAERTTRRLNVVEIENSIKTMAQGHIDRGLITGPVIGVSCSPVSGGSTDDLTESTTVFSCFVSNKDNGDGTQSGFKYNATMNWDTGSFTYGMGAP